MVAVKYDVITPLSPEDKEKFNDALYGTRVLWGTDDHGRGNFFYTSYYVLMYGDTRVGYVECADPEPGQLVARYALGLGDIASKTHPGRQIAEMRYYPINKQEHLSPEARDIKHFVDRVFSKYKETHKTRRR